MGCADRNRYCVRSGCSRALRKVDSGRYSCSVVGTGHYRRHCRHPDHRGVLYLDPGLSRVDGGGEWTGTRAGLSANGDQQGLCVRIAWRRCMVWSPENRCAPNARGRHSRTDDPYQLQAHN
ncbi:hypothetical protein D3C78_1371720 [compost metagenome]